MVETWHPAFAQSAGFGERRARPAQPDAPKILRQKESSISEVISHPAKKERTRDTPRAIRNEKTPNQRNIFFMRNFCGYLPPRCLERNVRNTRGNFGCPPAYRTRAQATFLSFEEGLGEVDSCPSAFPFLRKAATLTTSEQKLMLKLITDVTNVLSEAELSASNFRLVTSPSTIGLISRSVSPPQSTIPMPHGSNDQLSRYNCSSGTLSNRSVTRFIAICFVAGSCSLSFSSASIALAFSRSSASIAT